jgi:heptosyltransferase-1
LRYGFARDGVREWPNLLASNRRVALTPVDHHISERSLAVARVAFPHGQGSPLAGPLPVWPEAAARVEAQLDAFGLGGRRYAVLHYGTSWTTKLWPVANWQELLRHLVTGTDVVPLLTWGDSTERDVVERLAAAAGGHVVVWPRGSLPDLVALLARAAVVVGGDTGPVHIAAAVDSPTVSLFRVTDCQRNGPRGERHVCLQTPLDCSPCLRKSCKRDAECGMSIRVESVTGAIERLLASPALDAGQRS